MKYSAALLLLGSVAAFFGQPTNGFTARPRRDLVEMGKTVLVQGAAKLKEALDHGVNVKSEGKRSIDLFGFKFGGQSGVNAGFGDAANGGASENDDDLVRRRRAVDAVGAAQAASLLPQTPFGTNVNIVKVSSVSNVNNFREVPPAPEPTVATVASAARRRRTPDLLQLASFEKRSLNMDSEVRGDKLVKTHEALETVRGGTLIREHAVRNKRTPQSDDDGGEESTSGSPPKGPPRGGPRGPNGGGRGGPPPGGCRGGPPPGEDGSSTTVASTQRRKRELPIEEVTMIDRNKRSPKERNGASCRGGGGGRNTTPPTEDVRRKRDTSDYSSDYSEHDASDESTESGETRRKKRSVELHRNRREAFGGEMSGKVGSWFEQLAGVFVETVKKVVDVTKKSFGRGGQAQQ